MCEVIFCLCLLYLWLYSLPYSNLSQRAFSNGNSTPLTWKKRYFLRPGNAELSSWILPTSRSLEVGRLNPEHFALKMEKYFCSQDKARRSTIIRLILRNSKIYFLRCVESLVSYRFYAALTEKLLPRLIISKKCESEEWLKRYRICLTFFQHLLRSPKAPIHK